MSARPPEGCDGSGPHAGSNHLRVLETSPGSNAILCYACYTAELRWRRQRNHELAADCRFVLPAWDSLEVYA